MTFCNQVENIGQIQCLASLIRIQFSNTGVIELLQLSVLILFMSLWFSLQGQCCQTSLWNGRKLGQHRSRRHRNTKKEKEGEKTEATNTGGISLSFHKKEKTAVSHPADSINYRIIPADSLYTHIPSEIVSVHRQPTVVRRPFSHRVEFLQC